MYETDRRSHGRASLGRFVSLGLVGLTALVIAQACKTDPPDDGDGAGGSGGEGGSGGTVAGTGGTVTGGSGGNETGGNGGSAGEGGLGGQGGALTLDFDPESGISMIQALPSSVLGGALLIDRVVSCEEFTDARDEGAYWGDSESLFLTFGDKDRAELEPGSYPVTNLPSPDEGKYGSATLIAYDSECTEATEAAPSGVITITSVDGDDITGSYELVFPDGALEGSFSSQACPDFGWADSSAPSTCY